MTTSVHPVPEAEVLAVEALNMFFRYAGVAFAFDELLKCVETALIDGFVGVPFPAG